MSRLKQVVFIIKAGPIRADRCDAVAARLIDQRAVTGLELASHSEIYEWHPEDGTRFDKITLSNGVPCPRSPSFAELLLPSEPASNCAPLNSFFVTTGHLATFLTAALLRLLGKKVYVMNDSKFDDYARYLHREIGKALLYVRILARSLSGSRSGDYIRFLGIKDARIAYNYDAM